MTEEQRVRLEELITEYGNKEYIRGHDCSEYALSEADKARDRITDHLTLIQYNNALYNFQRFGVKDLDDLDLREWEKKSPVFMDVDNKDEDNAGVGVDLPKCLVESPIKLIQAALKEMSKVGK
tara:strand:- start:410 stop:778 length:369 start_codon:yes stop_codon:yes gene_type:complete